MPLYWVFRLSGINPVGKGRMQQSNRSRAALTPVQYKNARAELPGNMEQHPQFRMWGCRSEGYSTSAGCLFPMEKRLDSHCGTPLRKGNG